MRLWTLWLSAIALSAFAFLPGCGGSGSDAPPTGAGGESFTAEIALGGTETGVLTVEVDGTSATGTLVKDSTKGRGFPSIPDGTLTLSGSFTAPNKFSMTAPLAGGKTLVASGTLPGDETAGSYQLKVDSDTVEGGLLPSGLPKPTIAFSHPSVTFEPGEGAGLVVNGTNIPSGKILYRYFIAAPSAYFTDQKTPPTTGQDIMVAYDQLKIQTSVSDSGKLKAYCQAYLDKDGVKTFLAQTSCVIDLIDVQFLAPDWVEEVATNPLDHNTYHSFWWEFPLVPGAKEYQAMLLDQNTGTPIWNHRLLTGDIENAPVTTTPLYFGQVPHSAPPYIPVSEILTGTVRQNFTRRGNSVRVLIVVTDPGLEGPYREGYPMIIKVYK